jgi:hypothetical protein
MTSQTFAPTAAVTALRLAARYADVADELLPAARRLRAFIGAGGPAQVSLRTEAVEAVLRASVGDREIGSALITPKLIERAAAALDFLMEPAEA